VTEHWSAYHLNFGTTKNLTRIKRIFKNKNLNFIFVSDALRQDIEKFSGEKINYKIVGNTIDCSIFKNLHYERTENSFLMLSFWKIPKNPFMLFDVFSKLKKENFSFQLVVGGFGPLEDEMKQYVDELDLTKNVKFVGKLESNEIVDEMNKTQYFIHNSNYEVSSVVCMEAIACGAPVIASKVGGIPEYINSQNGILIENNSFENWYFNIKNSLLNNYDYNNQLISEYGYSKFSSNMVAQEYLNALNYFINHKN
jgi:L-malate glycosyltransferase